MAERDFAKELEQERDSHRRSRAQIQRLINAVRIAARMDKPTPEEINQLLFMAEGER